MICQFRVRTGSFQCSSKVTMITWSPAGGLPHGQPATGSRSHGPRMATSGRTGGPRNGAILQLRGRGEKLSFKPVSSDYRIGLSPFGTDIEIYRAETGVRKAPIVRKSRPRDSAHST